MIKSAAPTERSKHSDLAELQFFRRAEVKSQIRRLARHRNLTIVVGAGVGVEMGYPDWRTLVRRLLLYARLGPSAASDAIDREHAELVDLVLTREGPMGAATIARAELGASFNAAMTEALYGRKWRDVELESPFKRDRDPRAIAGSTAEAVAAVYSAAREVGHQCDLVTTNYDNTLELAVERVVGETALPWLKEESAQTGRHLVRHLHGTLFPKQQPRRLVLTEAEYHATGTDGALSWQESYLRRRLRESIVVFVGTSLTDPHLLSFLFRYARHQLRPVALLVREQDSGRKPDVYGPRDRLHTEYEALYSRRWQDTHVEVQLPDFHSQARQFLWEIAYHKTERRPVRYGRRLDRWFSAASHGLPLGLRDEKAFADAQDRIQALAHGWLDAVLELVREAGHSPEDGEALAIHLWCRAPARLSLGIRHSPLTSMAMVACSDRVWRTPEAIDSRRIMLPTRRAAIEAFCSGLVTRHDSQGGHQWNYVLAIPIVLRRLERYECLPVGAITIESTSSTPDAALRCMDRDTPKALQDIVDYLQGVGDTFLSPVT